MHRARFKKNRRSGEVRCGTWNCYFQAVFELVIFDTPLGDV